MPRARGRWLLKSFTLSSRTRKNYRGPSEMVALKTAGSPAGDGVRPVQARLSVDPRMATELALLVMTLGQHAGPQRGASVLPFHVQQPVPSRVRARGAWDAERDVVAILDGARLVALAVDQLDGKCFHAMQPVRDGNLGQRREIVGVTNCFHMLPLLL